MPKRPWIICPECEGEGKVVHPACSVWTADDIAEDPESFQFMMEGGYDKTCATCHGSGKIHEPTEEEMEAERERRADLRTRAMEDGDWEGYHNPDLYRY